MMADEARSRLGRGLASLIGDVGGEAAHHERPRGQRKVPIELIAGVTSENGRVVGLMPHPEHAIEDLTGPSTDGLGFFTSVLKAVVDA